MSGTPVEPDPVDAPFMKPVTVDQEGPGLILDLADFEAWLHALPIGYPSEGRCCSEVRLSADDGLTVTFTSSFDPWTEKTVHCPIIRWKDEQ